MLNLCVDIFFISPTPSTHQLKNRLQPVCCSFSPAPPTHTHTPPGFFFFFGGGGGGARARCEYVEGANYTQSFILQYINPGLPRHANSVDHYLSPLYSSFIVCLLVCYMYFALLSKDLICFMASVIRLHTL